MKTALIGHTGFVGSNLLQQGTFTAMYNSSNIENMRGLTFDAVWCSGVRASKWWANQNPDDDWADIAPLLDVLSTVHCQHFVLMSTVDVFQNSQGMNESHTPQRDGLHPYGLHRLKVEDFAREKFTSFTIIRLPGLFGNGLKKNAVYDLLHANQMEKIHTDARFQFYNLDYIYADCQRALEAGLDLIHFAVEPVSIKDIAQKAFGLSFENRPTGTPAFYDLQSVYADLYGGQRPYLKNRDQILAEMAAFVRRERGA